MDLLTDPKANAALLIFEIGNSHVSIATSIDAKIYTHQRFDLGSEQPLADAVRESWDALPSDRLRAAVAASVVPRELDRIQRDMPDIIGEQVPAVGIELHRPMSLALEHPESVGIDRICAAAAAYDTLKRACAVASFGTAITIDCVNDEGAFLGGAILPGLGLQARALASGTAQLPDVTIQTPDVVIGNNTEEAIQIGVLFGAVGALREIVERYAEELGNWPELVITGGNAELIHEHSDIVDHHVPDLCIRGIALAHRRHYAPFTETE